jgi:hypothetical protein
MERRTELAQPANQPQTALLRFLIGSAFAVFAIYLWAPRLALGVATQETIFRGADEVGNVLTFPYLTNLLTPAFGTMSERINAWGLLAFRGTMHALGLVAFSQLLYLCSRRVTMAQGVRWAGVIILAVSAVLMLYEATAPDQPSETWPKFTDRRLYGVWLPPVYFALGAAAVFVRIRFEDEKAEAEQVL